SRRRHTRFSRDWSSDVCSSDLAGHLAYEIAPEHRGHHYAARACRLVRPLAREHLEVAWIMTAPDNLASSRTAELAGAEYVDTRAIGRALCRGRRTEWGEGE